MNKKYIGIEKQEESNEESNEESSDSEKSDDGYYEESYDLAKCLPKCKYLKCITESIVKVSSVSYDPDGDPGCASIDPYSYGSPHRWQKINIEFKNGDDAYFELTGPDRGGCDDSQTFNEIDCGYKCKKCGPDTFSDNVLTLGSAACDKIEKYYLVMILMSMKSLCQDLQK